MSGHSIVAPSASSRRVQCPGSTRAEEGRPETDRTAAEEGTAAHFAASEMLAGNVVAEGQIAPNGLVLTEEMLDGAEVYDANVRGVLREVGLTPEQGHIEKPLPIHRIHPLSFGTPDFWIAWWVGAVLHIALWDFKFGYRFVDAYENWQAIEYLAGILALFPDVPDTRVVCTVRIVQPRSYHRDGPVRTWEVRAVDIRAHINVASNAAHAALNPDAPFKTGPECAECKARAACPTFLRSTNNAIDESTRDQPFDLPPAALSAQLRVVRAALKRLQACDVALSEQVQAHNRAGVIVPGWTVETGGGRLRWSAPVETIIGAGKVLGLDLTKTTQVVTPTQAEARGFPLAHFRDYTTSTRGAPVVVPDDGSRAARVFGTVS